MPKKNLIIKNILTGEVGRALVNRVSPDTRLLNCQHKDSTDKTQTMKAYTIPSIRLFPIRLMLVLLPGMLTWRKKK